MGWFSPKETPQEEQAPPPVRLASPEFVSGLVEIAEIYERREQMNRALAKSRAEELSQKTYFNYGELERGISEIKSAIVEALDMQSLASELRGWIESYEHRGRRPPYMPAPTPQAASGDGGYGE